MCHKFNTQCPILRVLGLRFACPQVPGLLSWGPRVLGQMGLGCQGLESQIMILDNGLSSLAIVSIEKYSLISD